MFLAGFVHLVLGLAVYSRDRHKISNIFFLLVGLSASVWSLVMAFYFVTTNPAAAHFAANIFYAAALGISIALVGFATYWTGRRLATLLAWLLSILATGYIGLILFFPRSVIRSISIIDGERYVEYNTSGLVLHNFLFMSLFLMALTILISGLRRQNRLKRYQTQYIIVGLISAGAVGTVFNLILPWLNIYSLFWVGPVFSIFFVGFVSFAIARHKLFDFHRTVARATAYLVTLGTTTAFYLLMIYLLSGIVYEEQTISLDQRLLLIGLAIAAAVLFLPLKRFFDQKTNKIFYHDAYEPQEFLDELNSTIVKDIELGVLLRQTTAVIQNNFKCEICFVEVLPAVNNARRTFGVASSSFNEPEIELISKVLSENNQKVLLVDELDSSSSKLARLLQKNDIAVLARLAPGGKSGQTTAHQTIAHLIIGGKKSGDIYNKSDIKIIQIVADELLIAIQNALRYEEIQGFAARLQKEVNQATAELQKNNQKLRELDESKDEFISMASHQLRTPLTAVKGYLSLLIDGDGGKVSATQKNMLNQAYNSSQRMVNLIADLLNVSRLKTGKFVIDTAPTNLVSLVSSEIDQLKAAAKIKRHSLVFKHSGDFPELMLDEVKIRQVIMNFVDNSIYYTPEGGKIEINLKQDVNNVYFTIKDNGIGVPADEKPNLFTKFYRANNARQTRPDGTGLGLFMAKKVVDAQGGHIIFDSTQNRGSTFGFTFNKKKKLLVKPDD